MVLFSVIVVALDDIFYFSTAPESVPDAVDHVLVHVHLRWRDIVEGYDCIGATVRTLLCIVVHVFPVPKKKARDIMEYTQSHNLTLAFKLPSYQKFGSFFPGFK